MALNLFITGTDTEVGKTYISAGILTAFNHLHFKTIGIKPLATGMDDTLKNTDAVLLQNASSLKLPYEQINPLLFAPAIAPHIAAQLINLELSVSLLIKKIQPALTHPSDVNLIEGVGGWDVPLNDTETMADFVKALNLKVILVVGIRLGCINHAILTYKAIYNKQVSVIGWVANCIDPDMKMQAENIETLKKWLPIPCLAVVQFKKNPDEVLNEFVNANCYLPKVGVEGTYIP